LDSPLSPFPTIHFPELLYSALFAMVHQPSIRK
jgi:hypothetical protein